jgi:sialate O-acetylesterase
LKLKHAVAAFVAALVTISGAMALADPATESHPFLDPMFSDNMVLQRDRFDPVWGWTQPGQTITVAIAGRTASATAGADGKWMAWLPKLPVGGPYTLSVSGPESTVCHNVLVGDVWICSGQSNMQFGIAGAVNGQDEIAKADYPNIRLFYVPGQISLAPTDKLQGQWEVCTPENVRSDGSWNGFSAVGYFFGRDLYRDLNVPIGLIHSSWGGTPAQAWTSEDSLRAKLPEFRSDLDALDAERDLESRGQKASLSDRIVQWYAKNDPGSTPGLGWADPSYDDSPWKTMSLPNYFQNAGDPEIAHVNGIIWFRRTFDVPAADAGKDLTLSLYVDDNDTTWVNGVEVGATEGYQVHRSYSVPASIQKQSGNVIAVRVLDTGGVGGIYGDPSTLAIADSTGAAIALAGSWKYRFAANLANLPSYPTAIADNPNYASVLYDGMIAPLEPYGIKGAIWYQGESNAWAAYQYRSLLPTMISDWRAHWNNSNFPFLVVQLAGFGHAPAQPGDDQWAELREAQWMTAHDTPNVGIATAIDIGNPDDIHPTNKQEVGRRLALVARRMVYHEMVEDSGPTYESMSVDGSAIRVRFDHVDAGLTTTDSAAPSGFAICGADRKWVWAHAEIDGATVIVSSPLAPRPIAVRYAWTAGPIGNMADKDGLPMFPFRTDRFPASTDWSHSEK